jgi:mRNA interferase MazF
MHKKDILNWSTLKIELDTEVHRPNVKTAQVRWCALGHNVGSEIDGKGTLYARPVVIIKIVSNHTCLVLPLTHSEKTGKHIHEFEFKGEHVKARLDQARIVDLKRIKDKVGEISEVKFLEIKLRSKEFLFS